jgi:hypothetical protein
LPGLTGDVGDLGPVLTTSFDVVTVMVLLATVSSMTVSASTT